MATITTRPSKDGSVSYRVRVRLRGHPIQTATFTRKTDAKRWAQQVEAAIREGRHFKSAESRRHTLDAAINRYVRSVLPDKSDSSFRTQHTQLMFWDKYLGHLALADISPALITEYRDRLRSERGRRGKKRSGATVNRHLAALSHVFTVAMTEWGWIDSNPLRRVSKLKEPRGRVRFLDDDERARLLAACETSRNSYLYAVVVLALSTGARRMEIMTLRWPDVDVERGLVVLHQTKNNERRGLPLQGHALELVKQLGKVRHLDTDLLFPSPHDPQQPIDLRKPWEAALRKANIEDFRFHDLRHSAASYLAMNGASLAEIAAVLGHRTLDMVKRYSHLSQAHTAQVVGRMNEAIFGE